MLGENGTISGYADCYDLINYTFELIEEPEEIDIQGIKEYNNYELSYMCKEEVKPVAYKCNELIKAVKQLDRKINKKYCCNCGVELDKNNTALPNMCNECKYGE